MEVLQTKLRGLSEYAVGQGITSGKPEGNAEFHGAGARSSTFRWARFDLSRASCNGSDVVPSEPKMLKREGEVPSEPNVFQRWYEVFREVKIKFAAWQEPRPPLAAAFLNARPFGEGEVPPEPNVFQRWDEVFCEAKTGFAAWQEPRPPLAAPSLGCALPILCVFSGLRRVSRLIRMSQPRRGLVRGLPPGLRRGSVPQFLAAES